MTAQSIAFETEVAAEVSQYNQIISHKFCDNSALNKDCITSFIYCTALYMVLYSPVHMYNYT